MTDDPPCDECTGSCCISYDVITLEPNEVEHFGIPHILIGSDGCVNTWKKAVAPFTMKDLRCAEILIAGM